MQDLLKGDFHRCLFGQKTRPELVNVAIVPTDSIAESNMQIFIVVNGFEVFVVDMSVSHSRRKYWKSGCNSGLACALPVSRKLDER